VAVDQARVRARARGARGKIHPLHRIIVAAGVLSLVLIPPVRPAVNPPNPIVVENQQPGTDAWQLGRTGFRISDDAVGQVKGYASATSVNKGGSISFHISVNPAQNFTADVYRMGWYGGLGARLMARVDPLPGATQRTCRPNRTTGVVDCAWSPTFTYTIPTTWTSGIYLVLLTNAQNYQSYITFVVRDDSRVADLLYQQSVTTYQAYNNYPRGTGKSLYDFNSYGATVAATGAVRAAKVSFDRPYSDGYGSGQLTGDSWGWERYYIGWLEKSGYDVTYSTNLDTHINGARLLDFKGFLSVGHDEYWSKAMVSAAATARDAGVNLGFFGSNTAYWQVRFEASAAGAANRVMICYKSADLDPVQDATATVLWRDPPVGRPEQSLVGVQYTAHLENDGQGAMYIVQNSSNWVWDGTGFADGSQVAGILGYESDRSMSEYQLPANRSYSVLAESPVVDAAGVRSVANTSIYQAPSGAWVFGSGTNHWSFGLGKTSVSDSRIQRATANILDRFLESVPPPPTPPPAPDGLAATAVSSTAVDLSWSDNSSNESNFTVEQSLDGAHWSVLTSLPQDSTIYRVTELTSRTTYRYRVKATNGAGSSAYSNVVTVTTPPQVSVMFAESFPAANGSPWDMSRWRLDTGAMASMDVQAGGGRMSFEDVSGARARGVATMPKKADTDTVASFRFSSTAARGYLYLFSRASGDWVSGNPNASYFVQITNDLPNVQLWKSESGATTSLGSSPGVASVTTAKQWLRFRVQGSSISVKVWTDGTAEPANWELTATDGSITNPGVLQVKWLRGSTATAGRDVILDDITVSDRAG
jgi:Fibronectin type III domain